MKKLPFYFLFYFIFLTSVFAERILWPTDSTLFFEGAPVEKFIQPAGSGKIESGLFGYVRNGGKRFHEGIDIKSFKKDKRGNAKDIVQAVFPGKVVHVNHVSGNSSYGRYVVIEHTAMTPAIYTLYAHLNEIDAGIRKGIFVEAGRRLGVMGNTSMSDKIPKNRSHLHFEMGLMLSNKFDFWYGEKKFSTTNKHSVWNGMNLVGFDPLGFYKQFKEGKVVTVQDYLQHQPLAFKIRVLSRKIPNFIERYPALCTKDYMPKDVIGWEIAFTWYGLPYRWVPLTASDVLGKKTHSLVITEYDASLIKRYKANKDMLVLDEGIPPKLGKRALQVVELLFL